MFCCFCIVIVAIVGTVSCYICCYICTDKWKRSKSWNRDSASLVTPVPVCYFKYRFDVWKPKPPPTSNWNRNLHSTSWL